MKIETRIYQKDYKKSQDTLYQWRLLKYNISNNSFPKWYIRIDIKEL